MADDLTRDAERIVLGSMMVATAAIVTATDLLTAADFADVRHGWIFEAIVRNHAAGAQTDPVGVAIGLNAAELLRQSGGSLYLAELVAAVPAAASVGWYAERVADAAKARMASADAARLLQVASGGDVEKIKAEQARLVEKWTGTADQRVGVPEPMTLRERLALPVMPVSWRIDDWLPVDCRTVLAAQFKAGKTTLAGNLVRSLVDGDLFLEQHKVNPIAGSLALFDIEMSGRQLDEWLRDQRITNDDRVVVFPMRGSAGSLNLLDPTTRSWWARTLRSHGCSYVLFDCLRPVLDALGLDEHREAGRLLTALDALLREADIAEATVVHHMGHTGERSRGDSRLRDWPDVEWRLVRQDDDPSSARFLSAYGRDVDMPESLLQYDRGTRHLRVVGGSRHEATAREALGDVLELLCTDPDLSTRKIEERITEAGVHGRDAVRDAVKLGVYEGKITTRPGPRNAILHAHINAECASARQCAAVRGARSCECASASIEARAHTLTPLLASARLCRACNHPLDPALGEDIHPTCGGDHE